MSDQEVAALSRKLDRVLSILENDNRTGDKGLVTQVSDLRDSFYGFRNQYNIDVAIRKTRDTIWKIIWGSIGAILIEVVNFIINWASKK